MVSALSLPPQSWKDANSGAPALGYSSASFLQAAALIPSPPRDSASPDTPQPPDQDRHIRPTSPCAAPPRVSPHRPTVPALGALPPPRRRSAGTRRRPAIPDTPSAPARESSSGRSLPVATAAPTG